MSNGSIGGSVGADAAPVQPTQVPCRVARTGWIAVTRPPGLRRHWRPSGVLTWSTGSRLATTTNEFVPIVDPSRRTKPDLAGFSLLKWRSSTETPSPDTPLVACGCHPAKETFLYRKPVHVPDPWSTPP